jgi:membrane protein YdbS with pleckstrin-like domain
MKNLMFILLWLCSVAALVLAVFKFLHKQWLPAVLLVVIGASVILMTVWSLRSLSRWATPLEAAEYTTGEAGSGGRIVMQVASTTLNETLSWALGFLIAAIGLVQFPDLLWKNWLSYPAAFVALLLVGVMILITTSQKLERVVADAHGMEVRTEIRGASVVETKVNWGQVGAVKRVAVYMKRVSTSRTRGPETPIRSEFVLLDREGGELLNIEDALDPPDKYKLFLESIPRWTGLPVQNEKVTK